VTANFFPRTNQVREAVAQANVRVVHDQRSARGDRAVYTGTNNWVELTGHPTVKSPEGEITNADVLIWDRTEDKFFGKNVAGTTTAPPLKGTNQPASPFTQRPK
jgi:lipopolysaccharide export system protein LptA